MYDTTPKTRRRYCPISIALAGLAAVLMLAADLDNSLRLFGAGLVCYLIAATALITLRTGVNTEVIEAARQAGYDAGHLDQLAVLQETQPTELRRVI
jgi:hypothetical protein